jgi:C4-dicarboxylate-specific signal transduction histidine kinase
MDGDTHRLNINVSLNLKHGLPNLIADDILLEQVILNLVRNAIEALSEKQEGDRKLVIKSSISDHGILVAISDNGPGIPEDIDDQIFYSFVTSKEQGLGMGLSVSRSIIEAHGGSLYVDRNTPAMTTFVFILPINKESKHD